jgi:hypothetical protein
MLCVVGSGTGLRISGAGGGRISGSFLLLAFSGLRGSSRSGGSFSVSFVSRWLLFNLGCEPILMHLGGGVRLLTSSPTGAGSTEQGAKSRRGQPTPSSVSSVSRWPIPSSFQESGSQRSKSMGKARADSRTPGRPRASPGGGCRPGVGSDRPWFLACCQVTAPASYLSSAGKPAVRVVEGWLSG